MSEWIQVHVYINSITWNLKKSKQIPALRLTSRNTYITPIRSRKRSFKSMKKIFIRMLYICKAVWGDDADWIDLKWRFWQLIVGAFHHFSKVILLPLSCDILKLNRFHTKVLSLGIQMQSVNDIEGCSTLWHILNRTSISHSIFFTKATSICTVICKCCFDAIHDSIWKITYSCGMLTDWCMRMTYKQH